MLEVTRTNLAHKGRTKFYETWLIENTDTGNAIAMFRWGPVGKGGQYDAKICSSKDEAAKAITKKLEEKLASGKGYFVEDTVRDRFSSGKDLILSPHAPVLRFMPKNAALHIDPDLGAVAMGKGVQETSYDRNGDARPSDRTMQSMEERDRLLREQKAREDQEKMEREQAATAKRAQDDPMWGRF